MSQPSSLTERRVRNLEERTGGLEETAEAHEKTLYELRRQAVRDDLRWQKLFGQMGIADVTDDEVDAVLDDAE